MFDKRLTECGTSVQLLYWILMDSAAQIGDNPQWVAMRRDCENLMGKIALLEGRK